MRLAQREREARADRYDGFDMNVRGYIGGRGLLGGFVPGGRFSGRIAGFLCWLFVPWLGGRLCLAFRAGLPRMTPPDSPFRFTHPKTKNQNRSRSTGRRSP